MGEIGKKLKKTTKKYRQNLESLRVVKYQPFLWLFDYNFKGAAYSASGTYGFALSTPFTIFHFDNSHNIIDHYQSTATAHADTQPTAITFFQSY
jgi:hypothetical protein